MSRLKRKSGRGRIGKLKLADREPVVGTPYKRIGGRRVFLKKQFHGHGRFKWVLPKKRSWR